MMHACEADRHGSIAYHRARIGAVRARPGATWWNTEGPYHAAMLAKLRNECAGRPVDRCVEPSPPPDTRTRIVLHYAAEPNLRTDRDGQPIGWLPVVWEDGHPSGNTWQTEGYDRETAETMARQYAESMAVRFVGDWNVQLVAGRPGVV